MVTSQNIIQQPLLRMLQYLWHGRVCVFHGVSALLRGGQTVSRASLLDLD